MKSLFLKIFLSFWVAQALFIVLAILVMLVLRPQRNSTWDALRTTALTEAIGAFEHSGRTTCGLTSSMSRETRYRDAQARAGRSTWLRASRSPRVPG